MASSNRLMTKSFCLMPHKVQTEETKAFDSTEENKNEASLPKTPASPVKTVPNALWSFSPCKKRKEPEKKSIKVEGIYTWDIDKTLIDEKGNLLFPERTRKILARIIAHGFRNKIVTARPHVLDLTDSTHPFSVNSVRERLGQHLFDGTYYTNGIDKTPTLDKIMEDYDLDSPSQICHVDDNDSFLEPIIEAGYGTARVNTEDPTSDEHLDTVEAHLEKMIALQNTTEEEIARRNGERANKRARV